MAYRELTMIDVREVLRRWQAKQDLRKIARDTGTDRKTVRRYIHWAEKLELPRDRALSDEDVHAVAQCVQDRTEPEQSDEWREVAKHKEQIEEWLNAKKPLRLTKIHELLVRKGLQASYWTLRRFAMKELGWHKPRATVLLEDPPAGQEAQVDFGKMGYLVDAETGKRRLLWALIVTLSYSRLSFVWPTFRQTTAAVCEGLDRAWQFYEAVPETIIPDNTKAIVADPDALSPKLTEAFADYVQARDLFVDPARIRSPKDKPRVENQVPYVRESWFDGEQFRDLDEARRSAEHWSGEIAGRRVHGTTRRVPLEVFEAEEKPAMGPPPTEPFDVPLWTDAKVHADHHIQVACALYSVPTRYLHQYVHARADSRTVRIYSGTELIKVHPRKPPGGRSTDTNDYPAEKAAYALRSVDAVLAKARQRGTHIGLYAERLLSGPLPWARMRQAYSLLRLCDKYGDGRVEATCQSSLAFDVVDVPRLKRMLKSAAKPPRPASRGGTVTQLTLPRFARDASHFETRKRSTDEEVS
jgi:transposase